MATGLQARTDKSLATHFRRIRILKNAKTLALRQSCPNALVRLRIQNTSSSYIRKHCDVCLTIVTVVTDNNDLRKVVFGICYFVCLT